MPLKHQSTTFKGDVLRLVTGTALAQIITVLAAPIVTRLYAPEAYGLAALFASLTGILSVLACMRYELSIVLPDNDREAANLLGVSLCFSVLIALLTVPIIRFGGTQVLRWVRMPELGPYLWLIPLVVLIQGVFIALNYWNTRTKHFTRLSIARVTSAISTTTATLGAGFAGHATSGAKILATVGGQAVATVVLGGQIWRDNGRFIQASITWREMWAGMKRYKKFPLIDSWSGLLNATSVQLPALMLGAFFSPAIVGFYALGYALLSLPGGLLGSAISQVFLQRASVAKATSSLASVAEGTFDRLLLIAAFPYLLLMLIGPDLFSFVFGAQWQPAGVFVQLLAPWLFFVFIGSPISSLIFVLELQETNLLFNIVLIISRVISLVIGGLFASPFLALGIFSFSGTLLWALFCYYLLGKAGVKRKVLFCTVGHRLMIGLLFLIPVVVAKSSATESSSLLLVTALFSGLAYYAFVVAQDQQIRQMVVDAVFRFRGE